jgi:hypothetical protein
MNPKNEDLKRLKQEWYKKLKEEGFQDIELPSGALRDIDRRSNAFENRSAVEIFYTKVEHFLTQEEIPALEREILTLYVQGMFLTRIYKALQIKKWRVKTVITKYKRLLKYD